MHGDPEAWKRYHAAMERARLEGFTYRSAAEVAQERHRESLIECSLLPTVAMDMRYRSHPIRSVAGSVNIQWQVVLFNGKSCSASTPAPR
jgi:hypothetical protein